MIDIFTSQFIQINQRTMDEYAGSDWAIPAEHQAMFQLDKPIKAVINNKRPDNTVVRVAFGKVVKLNITASDGTEARR